MKNFENFVKHLKFEALALAVLMFVLANNSNYSLWWLLASFPIIDLCMIGYVFGPKIGSISYNLVHDAAIPTFLIAYGLATDNKLVSMIGYVWTFHIAVDRTLGYGLKHDHSFNVTHLGKIKKD